MRSSRGKILLVLYKLLAGLLEIITGAASLIFGYLIRSGPLEAFFQQLARGELSEDPNDWLANWFLGQNPTALYSLSIHIGWLLIILGLSKLIIAVALWLRNSRLAIISLIILSLSVLALAFETITQFSWIKIISLGIDAVILVVLLFDSRALMKKNK